MKTLRAYLVPAIRVREIESEGLLNDTSLDTGKPGKTDPDTPHMSKGNAFTVTDDQPAAEAPKASVWE